MKLKITASTRFKRDLKRASRRGRGVDKLHAVVDILRHGKFLEARHRPHRLSGDWEGYMECHIEPDWLLIYEMTDTQLILVRTGTHADLF